MNLKNVVLDEYSQKQNVHIRLFHLYEGLEQAISLYHNRNQIIVDWGWE